MPLINVRTSRSVLNSEDLLKCLSLKLSELTGKPENYVMTCLESSCNMTFAGNSDPCCFIEIKSIGALSPSKMSKVLCDYISKELEITSNRIYIQFEDVQPHLWGWNASTFG